MPPQVFAIRKYSQRRQAVGGKRASSISLNLRREGFLQAFENRNLPPLTFPKTFKTSPDLVRDQGVGGSNPLSPTNIFNELRAVLGFLALRV